MMIYRGAVVALASLSATAVPVTAQEAVDAGNVYLQNWTYDNLNRAGTRSVEALFGNAVENTDGDQIGEVEDLVMNDAGEVVALIAEVGGVWDIGDTHVSVPWNEVQLGSEGVVTVPVTQSNFGDYDLFASSGLPSSADLDSDVVAGVDDEQLGSLPWRASDLIGDYVRVREDSETWANFGYVSDILIDNGEIQATLVTTTPVYGPGTYAYPYRPQSDPMPPAVWVPQNSTQDLPVLVDEALSLPLYQTGAIPTE